jgi:hypothetical protein
MLNLFEIILCRSTDRAYPIIRELFKRRVGGYPAIRVSNLRVINVTANYTFVFVHIFSFLLFYPVRRWTGFNLVMSSIPQLSAFSILLIITSLGKAFRTMQLYVFFMRLKQYLTGNPLFFEYGLNLSCCIMKEILFHSPLQSMFFVSPVCIIVV